jgi:hypothetical protein
MSLMSRLPSADLRSSLSRVFSGIIGYGSFIWSISAIELIIRWNKISGVHTLKSTGQYFPLVIGLCSFTAVVYELIKNRIVSPYLIIYPNLQSIHKFWSSELKQFMNHRVGKPLPTSKSMQITILN